MQQYNVLFMLIKYYYYFKRNTNSTLNLLSFQLRTQFLRAYSPHSEDAGRDGVSTRNVQGCPPVIINTNTNSGNLGLSNLSYYLNAKGFYENHSLLAQPGNHPIVKLGSTQHAGASEVYEYPKLLIYYVT